MRAAILQQHGSDGLLLAVALAYERADWAGIDWGQLDELGLDADRTQEAYIDSLQWAHENLQLLR